MRVHEAVHTITYALLSVPAQHRHFTLYAVRQSLDSNTGELIVTAPHLDTAVHCRDCPDFGKCPDDCPYREGRE